MLDAALVAKCHLLSVPPRSSRRQILTRCLGKPFPEAAFSASQGELPRLEYGFVWEKTEAGAVLSASPMTLRARAVLPLIPQKMGFPFCQTYLKPLGYSIDHRHPHAVDPPDTFSAAAELAPGVQISCTPPPRSGPPFHGAGWDTPALSSRRPILRGDDHCRSGRSARPTPRRWNCHQLVHHMVQSPRGRYSRLHAGPSANRFQPSRPGSGWRRNGSIVSRVVHERFFHIASLKPS